MKIDRITIGPERREIMIGREAHSAVLFLEGPLRLFENNYRQFF